MREMRSIIHFEHVAVIKRKLKAALARVMSYVEYR